jgi:hypothetical protein
MSEDKRSIIVAAINGKFTLQFLYHGTARVGEPQAYGISTAGNEVLRVYQREGGSKSGKSQALKLLAIAKISKLRRGRQRFKEARPEHNPNDSAMIKVIAALPSPKTRPRT